jgi:hypothetical protein
MRNVFFVLVVGASACAARSSHTTLPTEYLCGDVAVTRNGSEVRNGPSGEVGRLSWRDDAGEHFVAWPISPTDHDATELIVPSDPHLDAVQHTYDTTFGSSTGDWRLVEKKQCRAKGGPNDMLTRYMMGESIDDLTTSFGVESREETRSMIRKAMVSLQRRYWRDR